MLSPFTIGKALVSFVRLVRDPSRLAEVFDLADNLEKSDMLAGVVSELSEDPAARRAFEERPRVGRIDLDALGKLPPGTLAASSRITSAASAWTSTRSRPCPATTPPASSARTSTRRTTSGTW